MKIGSCGKFNAHVFMPDHLMSIIQRIITAAKSQALDGPSRITSDSNPVAISPLRQRIYPGLEI